MVLGARSTRSPDSLFLGACGGFGKSGGTGRMVGEDAIEIDAVGIGSGQAWVEVEEMAVGLESGLGE